MKKTILIFILTALLSGVAAAQKAKPWTEWEKKDVEKMLNNSAWGQTQANTDTAEMFYSPTSPNQRQTVDGATNQAMTYNYRVRFFSAKPIREAFARKILLDNPKIQPAQLQNFINGDYSESIVVAITFDGADRRYTGEIEKAFHGATTEILRKGGAAYLETNSGTRVMIEEYAPPSSDGTGAKFVFPRMVDGKPFLTPEAGGFRFVAIMGNGVSISRRFKLSDMMYDGKLEL